MNILTKQSSPRLLIYSFALGTSIPSTNHNTKHFKMPKKKTNKKPPYNEMQTHKSSFIILVKKHSVFCLPNLAALLLKPLKIDS